MSMRRAHLEPLTSDVKRRKDMGDYELVRKGTPTNLKNAFLGVLIKEKVDAKAMELLKENNVFQAKLGISTDLGNADLRQAGFDGAALEKTVKFAGAIFSSHAPPKPKTTAVNGRRLEAARRQRRIRSRQKLRGGR